jgi:hypothetical protein
MALMLSAAPAAWGGVFNTPHFLQPGQFGVGVEPELTLTNGAGMAANARYTQGLSDINNFTVILGTGGGPRRFRAGGNFTFDFFPDVDKQPGIGVAAQAIYYRIPEAGRLELAAVPYIHKNFASNGSEFDPFVALPIGFGFTDGQYKSISNIAVGSMFKTSETIRTVIEIGVAINNQESYISGGLIYYH